MAQFQSCGNDTGKAGAWKSIHQPRLISYTICPGMGRVENDGADDKSTIVGTTQWVEPRSWILSWMSSEIWAETGWSPPSRTLNIPWFLNSRWNRFFDPASIPLDFGLDLELNLYIQYVGGWGVENNNHLIVEITDPDHYQNLINPSQAWGWALWQISWKFVRGGFRHHADIQIKWQRWKCSFLERWKFAHTFKPQNECCFLKTISWEDLAFCN